MTQGHLHFEYTIAFFDASTVSSSVFQDRGHVL